jgi:hypothetical protein
MGWPRKYEDMRIYKDKGNNGYFMIIMEDYDMGNYGAIVNVYEGPRPSLIYGNVGHHYIASQWLKRIQWDALPEEWQQVFTEYNSRDPNYEFRPEKIRGFWRIGRQPVTLGASHSENSITEVTE